MPKVETHTIPRPLTTVVGAVDYPEVLQACILPFLDGASLSQYGKAANRTSEISKKQWMINVEKQLLSSDPRLLAKNLQPKLTQEQAKDFYVFTYRRFIKTAESLLRNKSILRTSFKEDKDRYPHRTILHAIWRAGLTQLFIWLLTKTIHEFRASDALKAELDAALFSASGEGWYQECGLLVLAARSNVISAFHLLSEKELRRAANDPEIFKNAGSTELLVLFLRHHDNPSSALTDSQFLAEIIQSEQLRSLQFVLNQLSSDQCACLLIAEDNPVNFLYIAAETGNEAVFTEILKRIPADKRPKALLRSMRNGENLLHAAASKGKASFVKGVATLMALAQAKGDGNPEIYRRHFACKLSVDKDSPIDIAARNDNIEALEYLMNLLAAAEKQELACANEHRLLKIAAAYNAVNCFRYLWENIVSRLDNTQRIQIAIRCLQSISKRHKVDLYHQSGTEVIDFILSQFPNSAEKEQILNESKALIYSVKNANGLLAKVIASYPNRYHLMAYISEGLVAFDDELPVTLLRSKDPENNLEKVFALFDAEERIELITRRAPNDFNLLLYCLTDADTIGEANQEAAFLYLISQLSLQQRAEALTEIIPNDRGVPDLCLLTFLSYPEHRFLLIDNFKLLIPTDEQIQSLRLSDQAKEALRAINRQYAYERSRYEQEAGPQP